MPATIVKRTPPLPPVEEMYKALCDRDSEYEGLFFVGVRTTGIFCRPTCPARKPKLENVDFYRCVNDALSAGFRPCKKCRPLETAGAAPQWLDRLLKGFEAQPALKWTDAEMRSAGINPVNVRRWFKQHHGMTFHGYMRARRLAQAMGQIQTGRPSTAAALENGYDSLSGFNAAFKRWAGTSPSNSKNTGPPVTFNRILTPLGPMVVAVADGQLCLLEFADRRMLETQIERLAKAFKRPFVNDEDPLITRIEKQLIEYFDGNRTTFDIPLAIRGSEFQVAVWNELLDIPHGETRSYEQIAVRIGKRGAQRAVGRANGDNRIAIIIPCHRVIRSNGELSGYGGQVWRKRWLLDHEQKTLFD